jgi:AcrR family transcriptional regulator
MPFQIRIQSADKLALRDPEDTTLGRNIVRKGLILMAKLGYEQFTFKKLAESMQTTEASVYRYFENKHRFLLYILTWYWTYLEYLVVFQLQNIGDPAERIRRVIELLVYRLPDGPDNSEFDKDALYTIVIAESSKAYLTREVGEINRVKLFKPYKDLCGRIAELFKEYSPDYAFPRSLASNTIEMAHMQVFFMKNLPSLTDFSGDSDPDNIVRYLHNVVFAALDKR